MKRRGIVLVSACVCLLACVAGGNDAGVSSAPVIPRTGVEAQRKAAPQVAASTDPASRNLATTGPASTLPAGTDRARLEAPGTSPAGNPAGTEPADPEVAGQLPKKPDREREGTLWTERIGRFETVDLRVVFHCFQDDRSYTVLENLALERVARALGDATEDLRWSVSGVLTEFNGQNYLLVTRAVIKAGEVAE